MSPEADPGVEDMLIDKVEGAMGQKVTEPGDYDADEQMPGGGDLEKTQNRRVENTGLSTVTVAVVTLYIVDRTTFNPRTVVVGCCCYSCALQTKLKVCN